VIELGEREEEAVRGTFAMFLEGVISSVPSVKCKMAVCTGDAIRSVLGRIVKPSCCCKLLYGWKASRGI
jgi:hypothetical protein